MMILMSAARLVLIVLILIAIIGVAYGGYRYSLKRTNGGSASQPSSTPISNPISVPNSLIKSQQVIIEGVIVKKDSQSITIQGFDKKEVALKLSPTLIIYPAPTKSNLPSRATSDINAIQTGKSSLITLEPQGSEYLVKTISYAVASGSATKK